MLARHSRDSVHIAQAATLVTSREGEPVAIERGKSDMKGP